MPAAIEEVRDPAKAAAYPCEKCHLVPGVRFADRHWCCARCALHVLLSLNLEPYRGRQ